MRVCEVNLSAAIIIRTSQFTTAVCVRGATLPYSTLEALHLTYNDSVSEVELQALTKHTHCILYNMTSVRETKRPHQRTERK